jgi:hypothetical protein
VPLLISEAVKVLAVEPIAIRLVGFQFHFDHAGLLVCLVFGLPHDLGRRILPSRRLTPGLIGHRFAERDANLNNPGRDVLGPGFGDCFDDNRRKGIHVLGTNRDDEKLAETSNNEGSL